MASAAGRFEDVGPGYEVTESMRVDKVSPRARRIGALQAVAVMAIALFMLIPVFVMGITIFHITREFDHIDSGRLSNLRD